jgi:thioredoxin
MKYALIIFLTIFGISCQSQSNNVVLSPKEFQKKIAAVSDAVIIDVRTPEEFKGGSISKAVNIDFNDNYFEIHTKQLDIAKTYFVYCLSGGRSSSAAAFMRKNGFKNVYELDGGIMAWRNADLPIVNESNVELSDKITEDNYKQITESAAVVLIDFYAPWCGPCKKMQPLLDKLSKEYEGKASIVRINIDENKKLTRSLGIDEIPYFKLYRNGKEIGNFIGQMDRDSFIRILDGK